MIFGVLGLLMLFYSGYHLHAQESDTIQQKGKFHFDIRKSWNEGVKARWKESKIVQMYRTDQHSAQRATIQSAVLPGWGQAYNKKYWKIPIVWGGLAGVGYFYYTNQSGYNQYKEYYVTKELYPDSTLGIFETSLSGIYSKIEEYRDARDLSVLIMLAVWGLNVIDANVDGHFYNFDIDEDLSMRLQPASWMVTDRRQAYGVSLVLTMH